MVEVGRAVGVGQTADRFRANLGFQHNFQLPPRPSGLAFIV